MKITDRREGVDYVALGEYLEMEWPSRVVFTFGMPQFSPEFCRVTVEVAKEEEGEGSVLTFTQDNLPLEHHEATMRGWWDMFRSLEELLAGRLN